MQEVEAGRHAEVESLPVPHQQPAGEAPLVAVLYLAELSARYLADRQAEAGARLGQPGTWLIPTIEEAMRKL